MVKPPKAIVATSIALDGPILAPLYVKYDPKQMIPSAPTVFHLLIILARTSSVKFQLTQSQIDRNIKSLQEILLENKYRYFILQTVSLVWLHINYTRNNDDKNVALAVRII